MARGVVYLLPAAVVHSPHPAGGLDALVSQVSSQEYHYPAIIDFIYKWKLFLQAKVQLFQHFIFIFHANYLFLIPLQSRDPISGKL